MRVRRFVLLGLLAALVLLPRSPIGNLPGRDSGVFLYVGDQILDGKIPYRDVWDHKGPLLYYIIAFGLLIGRGSIWGVWILEYLLLCLAASVGFQLLKEAFGAKLAIVSTIGWLLNSSLLHIGGNFTEEYTLPLQFAALYLFWRSLESGNNSRHFFAIGLTLGTAFLLRPNNIGTHLSIGVYVVLSSIVARAWGSLLRKIAMLLAGVFATLGPTAVFFASHHALADLIDQLFIYNLKYVSASPENRLVSIMVGLVAFISFGLIAVVLAAWIMGWYRAVRQTIKPEKKGALVYLALIGLPIEAFLAGFSGLIFAHYVLALLPMFAILTSFFVDGLVSNLSQRSPAFTYGVLLFVLSLTTYGPMGQIAANLSRGHPYVSDDPLLTEVQLVASTHDYLLMWGAEAAFNFLTDTATPSRFVYQYPLYTANYATQKMADEFMDGIVRKRPLIIDTSASNHRIPPLDSADRSVWLEDESRRKLLHVEQDIDQLQDVFAFIEANYALVGITEKEQWRIYAFVDEN